MNGSDSSIKAAQRRNLRLKFGLGIVIGGAIIGYLVWLLLAKGFVIKVAPEEAAASKFIVVTEGSGIVIGESVYTLGGDVKVDIGAYKFITQSIAVSSASPSMMEVVLEPSPGQLILNTNAGSKDTNWYINGQLVHIGETLNKALSPDNYVIGVDDKFHVATEVEIAVASLDKIQQTIELVPIDGSLSISSQPSGAQVIINNQVSGNTPLQIEATGGDFDIQVVAEGYEILTDTIELSNTETTPSRHYILEPKKATLNINATPTEGILLINGKAVSLGKNTVVANQNHTILFEMDGYFPFTQTVNLKPGESTALNIELKPEFGSVIVNTKPNALIKVNGQAVGSGAFNAKLPAISHTVEISKPGYRTVSKTIKPSSKRLSKVDVVLMTEFDARRAEGRPLYIDSIGIEMTKYRMNAFTMGSPANEKGRRRNEFPVAVEFTKPVWVSRHEITEAQYREFEPGAGNSTMPVTNVSWNDAALFCNWLSEQEGLPPFYQERNGTVIGFDSNSKGYRLPTEAEWEWLAKKAKRAKSTIYHWGNTERLPDNAGNFADKSAQGSQSFYLKKYDDGSVGKAPVGSFRSDRAGLFDLAGNVSEWVHDFYSSLPPATQTFKDYTGSARGSAHIWKGSNYKSGRLAELRAAYRESSETSSDTIGFRIARYD